MAQVASQDASSNGERVALSNGVVATASSSPPGSAAHAVAPTSLASGPAQEKDSKPFVVHSPTPEAANDDHDEQESFGSQPNRISHARDSGRLGVDDTDLGELTALSSEVDAGDSDKDPDYHPAEYSARPAHRLNAVKPRTPRTNTSGDVTHEEMFADGKDYADEDGDDDMEDDFEEEDDFADDDDEDSLLGSGRARTKKSLPRKKSSRSGNSAPRTSKRADKPFMCEHEQCDKAFARRSDLVRHARIHTNERPYICPYPQCRKSFIQRSALTVHIRVHTGERPHKCEVCQRTFSDSSSLARHRRIHTGMRPYVCPIDKCYKDFCRKSTLIKHLEKMHDIRDAEVADSPAPVPAARGGSKRKKRARRGKNDDELDDDDVDDDFFDEEHYSNAAAGPSTSFRSSPAHTSPPQPAILSPGALSNHSLSSPAAALDNSFEDEQTMLDVAHESAHDEPNTLMSGKGHGDDEGMVFSPSQHHLDEMHYPPHPGMQQRSHSFGGGLAPLHSIGSSTRAGPIVGTYVNDAHDDYFSYEAPYSHKAQSAGGIPALGLSIHSQPARPARMTIPARLHHQQSVPLSAGAVDRFEYDSYLHPHATENTMVLHHGQTVQHSYSTNAMVLHDAPRVKPQYSRLLRPPGQQEQLQPPLSPKTVAPRRDSAPHLSSSDEVLAEYTAGPTAHTFVDYDDTVVLNTTTGAPLVTVSPRQVSPVQSRHSTGAHNTPRTLSPMPRMVEESLYHEASPGRKASRSLSSGSTQLRSPATAQYADTPYTAAMHFQQRSYTAVPHHRMYSDALAATTMAYPSGLAAHADFGH